MNPLALTYLILGLLGLIWPLALLLFRRRVLGAQWLMAVAVTCLSLSLIVYSCLFNNFLHGEYLLVVLFMILALATPPCAMIAVTALTRTQGLNRSIRLFFLPSIIMALLLALSVAVGGDDMYRLWIFRGSEDMAHKFYANSLRYNIIVFVHFYLFSVVLALEVIVMAIYTFLQLRRYHRTMREYIATPSSFHKEGYIFLICMVVESTIVALSLTLYPFNSPRPLTPVVLMAIVQGIAIVIMGFFSYRLNYGAELLARSISNTTSPLRHDPYQLGKAVSQYVEQGAYRDPDLTVFSLSSHFKVSQDQMVDAIHLTHGVSFADYLDSIRVEHAHTLLMASDRTEPSNLTHIAHQSGYLDEHSLQHAYRKVMRTPLPGTANGNDATLETALD